MYQRCRNCNRAIEIKVNLTPHKAFKSKPKKKCECGHQALTRVERNRTINNMPAFAKMEVFRSDGQDWVLNEERTHFKPLK